MEVNINGQQEMAIPLFYLKYIDDKKATDNLVTGIQIGVDIALTLAPIGNLSKLKHISRLTKFGRAIAGKTIVEGPGEVLLRLELAQGVVSAVEITAGLASIYYNYAKQVEEVCDVTSSQYDQEKCINYRRLADLFMYIGLVNGVLDVVAARKVKNVAKKILDSPIANTLDIDVYTILRKFAEPLGDAIEATNTFWVYIRDPKNKELLTQGFIDLWENTNIWTEALRTKFITDFSTEVVQLRYFQSEEILTRWRQLATREIPLSGNIRFLQDPVAANRLVELFDSPSLKSVYTVLLDTKTRTESLTAFLRKFDDLGATYYQKFADDTDLVKSWFRYFDIPEISEEFYKIEQGSMVKWCEFYGILPNHLLDDIKTKPLIFRNWDKLDEVDKQLLKNIPEEWIPSVHQYQYFCFIKKMCPVEIPVNVVGKEKAMANNYLQVYFKWTDDNYKWEVRAHTEIPNSPGMGNGNVWIVNRRIPGEGAVLPVSEILLENKIWYNYEPDFKNLMNRQRIGVITEEEKQILKSAHFKAK